MAKNKKKAADLAEMYRLSSLINSTLLRVTLCLQETLRGRFLFLYTRGCRIINASFAKPENNPKP